MVSQALVSTALMGLLLVAVFVFVSRIGTLRERERLESVDSGRYEAINRRLSFAAKSPLVWTIGFVAVALVVIVTAAAAVGGFDVPAELAPTLYQATLAIVGVLLAGFLFLGPYFGARQRGLGNAHSVIAGLSGLGGALLLLIATRLVVG